ncbi:MAG TPA: HAMP domain-containing histidine kinase, partial [Thermoplasmatales archaeon]|nr:HAMP domain-containing histidine kinase [Thermoplasmatales archaeon]
KEIVEDVKQSIEDKQLDFIVEIPEDLPSIIGDPDRLSQVFKNLITNAIKFTDRGSITLSAKKNKNNIEIYVRDTGIGIPKGELNNIFKKFYQVDMKEKRMAEGTGLGLYICKEIVEKHNGSIHVESSPGEGSTFIITLPTSIISS